jgi:hypothetical protein
MAQPKPLFFSHPDFNRRFWSFTRSTVESLVAVARFAPSFGPIRRVADFNRRLRFSLTPKNVVAFLTLLKTERRG